MNKYILAAIGIGIVGIGYYSIRKYNAAKKIIENVTMQVIGIRDIRVVSLQKITFKLRLKLINETSYHLGVSANSRIFIKHIQMLTPQGKLVAQADTKINVVEIPANDSIILPDFMVEMPINSLIGNIPSIVEHIISGMFVYNLTIEAFGKDFTMTA